MDTTTPDAARSVGWTLLPRAAGEVGSGGGWQQGKLAAGRWRGRDGVDWRLVVGPGRCEGVGRVGRSVAERSKGWASLSVGKHMPRGVGCVRRWAAGVQGCAVRGLDSTSSGDENPQVQDTAPVPARVEVLGIAEC
jgi:hypothetical protein